MWEPHQLQRTQQRGHLNEQLLLMHPKCCQADRNPSGQEEALYRPANWGTGKSQTTATATVWSSAVVITPRSSGSKQRPKSAGHGQLIHPARSAHSLWAAPQAHLVDRPGHVSQGHSSDALWSIAPQHVTASQQRPLSAGPAIQGQQYHRQLRESISFSNLPVNDQPQALQQQGQSQAQQIVPVHRQRPHSALPYTRQHLVESAQGIQGAYWTFMQPPLQPAPRRFGWVVPVEEEEEDVYESPMAAEQAEHNWRVACRWHRKQLVRKGWRAWRIGMVVKRRQAQQLENIDRRYERGLQIRILQAWSMHTRHMVRRAADTRQLQQKWGTTRLYEAFQCWRSAAEESSREVRRCVKAALHARKVHMCKAFKTWLEFTSTHSRLKFLQQKAEQHALIKQLRKCLCAWAAIARRRQHYGLIVERALANAQRNRLAACFSIWQQELAACKQARMQEELQELVSMNRELLESVREAEETAEEASTKAEDAIQQHATLEEQHAAALASAQQAKEQLERLRREHEELKAMTSSLAAAAQVAAEAAKSAAAEAAQARQEQRMQSSIPAPPTMPQVDLEKALASQVQALLEAKLAEVLATHTTRPDSPAAQGQQQRKRVGPPPMQGLTSMPPVAPAANKRGTWSVPGSPLSGQRTTTPSSNNILSRYAPGAPNGSGSASPRGALRPSSANQANGSGLRTVAGRGNDSPRDSAEQLPSADASCESSLHESQDEEHHHVAPITPTAAASSPWATHSQRTTEVAANPHPRSSDQSFASSVSSLQSSSQTHLDQETHDMKGNVMHAIATEPAQDSQLPSAHQPQVVPVKYEASGTSLAPAVDHDTTRSSNEEEEEEEGEEEEDDSSAHPASQLLIHTTASSKDGFLDENSPQADGSDSNSNSNSTEELDVEPSELDNAHDDVVSNTAHKGDSAASGKRYNGNAPPLSLQPLNSNKLGTPFNPQSPYPALASPSQALLASGILSAPSDDNSQELTQDPSESLISMSTFALDDDALQLLAAGSFSLSSGSAHRASVGRSSLNRRMSNNSIAAAIDKAGDDVLATQPRLLSVVGEAPEMEMGEESEGNEEEEEEEEEETDSGSTEEDSDDEQELMNIFARDAETKAQRQQTLASLQQRAMTPQQQHTPKISSDGESSEGDASSDDSTEDGSNDDGSAENDATDEDESTAESDDSFAELNAALAGMQRQDEQEGSEHGFQVTSDNKQGSKAAANVSSNTGSGTSDGNTDSVDWSAVSADSTPMGSSGEV